MFQMREVIEKINKSADEADFVTTRKLIEANMAHLHQHLRKLNRNARELFEFLVKNLDNDFETLTRQELGEINVINTYATRFDIRGLKVYIKNKGKLLIKKEVIRYLNSDAKILLESMGAIMTPVQRADN
ncbi:hypothetical protein [Neobacillus terrae]|uniref:hypothetical protein n=1 Tax=Neobacillus terrae TaxID=3034837 RepID=UPI00140C4713|nr:hypothetical protein [Neobacillus terrae]NHM30936.1 hypothetical protein [Neobacillus terrae]